MNECTQSLLLENDNQMKGQHQLGDLVAEQYRIAGLLEHSGVGMIPIGLKNGINREGVR